MKKYNEILIFSDLEGTLIDEESGEIDKEGFEAFLQELLRLENKMQAVAGIHIVSPMGVRRLESIIIDFDDLIEEYNLTHRTSLRKIVAGCSPAIPVTDYEYESRYVVTVKSHGQSGGKKFYVETMIRYLKDRRIQAFPIYIGNGLNDIEAMRSVKEEGGIVLSPKDGTNPNVIRKANYVGEGKNIRGVTNALRQYVKDLALEERDR